ncbi:glycosyltransferase [Lichenihabitans sp. PAMC28606]|uniref:glycosyltransferase n=1 Tax=Lichenihabitans sp. PAMC28606 TaxID=2880932 RepID=UPI001D0AB19E|nr:glycosyltransferase [Lichenihabitans sp. PAMC28606]UDL95557.1 glycosyltransferase [Lichenihabitans sp. PAMC28606]
MISRSTLEPTTLELKLIAARQPASRAIVAIPACNEIERIGLCLAALAVQRDRTGAPLGAGTFEVLVYANNCTDGTAASVRALAPLLPFGLHIVEAMLDREKSHAGWARKFAMDAAAARLTSPGRTEGIILTTDADTIVAADWVANTLTALSDGADAVAGYVDAHPAELMRLGAAFLQRGRWEDTYLAAMAEMIALCDPHLHDPWPNHRVASGASLAVTLEAYRAIGGLPPMPVGEDAALVKALGRAGFKVRHTLAVSVTTSARLDGRAVGGAADTMRFRHENPDAVCDADLEPAHLAWRRAFWKGYLRRWHHGEAHRPTARWAFKLRLESAVADAIARENLLFDDLWAAVEAKSPRLRRRPALRPSELPAEIERAEAIIKRLRRRAIMDRVVAPDDTILAADHAGRSREALLVVGQSQ